MAPSTRAPAALRPGAVGWEVDAAAREALVRPATPSRSTRSATSSVARRTTAVRCSVRGGTATERPLGVVEEGNVYTLEFGTAVPGRGYIGLEENVVVTRSGVEWLSTPQRDLWLIP